MESRLEDIGRHFMEVEADFMKNGEIKARARLAEVRSDFVEKRNEVRSSLSAVKKAGSSALHEAQEGAVNAWNELTDALDRAKEELAELKN